jgi:hypothetical protein
VHVGRISAESSAVKRSDIFTVILLVVIVVATQLVRALVPQSATWAGFSLPQVILFPLVCVALWRIAIGGVRLPRSVIVLAGVCALGAVGFSFAWRGDRRSDFLIARLVGDSVEAHSKVLRDAVNAAVPVNSEVRAVRYFREIDTVAEARRALALNRQVPALVWGNERTLVVSFATEDGIVALRDLDFAPSVGDELQIVVRVTGFSIAAKPANTTAVFLGRLFAGLLPELVVGSGRIPGGSGGAEAALQEALQLVDRWTSFSHRGYAAFALGNHYMMMWLRSGGREVGVLRCAANAYRAGRKLFRARENPELAMALANNSGVAVAILGSLTGDAALAKRARTLWRLGRTGPRDQRRLVGSPLARLAAWHNLTVTESVQHNARRSRTKRAQPR